MVDGRDDAVTGMSWFRGDSSEQELHSLNFQSVGMLPWTQQGVDLACLRNDLNQQYQAMLAASLQNLGSGDLLRHQLLQLQQPVQYLQQSCGHNPILQQQQQVIQQPISPHIPPVQTQMIGESLSRSTQQVNNQQEQQQQQNTYQEAYVIQHDHLQRSQQTNVPSSSFLKTEFSNSNANYSASVPPSRLQDMLSSLRSEGSSNLLNFSRTGQSMLSEQPPQQSWAQKFFNTQVYSSSHSVSLTYSGKDAIAEQETCGLDAQSQATFGANMESTGLLLPTTVSSIGTSSNDAGMSSMPLGSSGYQSSLHGYSSESHNTGQLDPMTPSHTFVKVYKSGSVGRLLDISRFNSYHELRQELGCMFAIEGLLEDPRRSGWQLVFVDRENDILLLGDDPWEAFVNNVSYIKILSPQDVQKLGKPDIESFSQNAGDRMNTKGTNSQDLIFGLTSLGSLEY